MANFIDGILPDLVANIFPALTGQAVTVRTTTDTDHDGSSRDQH
jgi:hypothetical protein